jgi:dephospho-CoA kinase
MDKKEAKLSNLVDKILLIATNSEIQVKRLISKRKMSRFDARTRIRSQWPISRKIKKSDWVIWNNDSKATLHSRLRQFEKKLLTLRARGV